MHPYHDAELDGLLRDLCDGSLDAAATVRLESILVADRKARDEYRRRMQMEALLECGLAGTAANPARERPSHHVEGSVPEAFRGQGSAEGVAGENRTARPVWAAAMLAVSLAVLGLVAVASRRGSGNAVATLTAATDARLVDPQSGRSIAVTAGTQLPSGPLRLERGGVQIEFADGAVVGMNAPAEVELVNPRRVFLRQGRIVPLVPPRAKGFTVILPGGEIIDLGTEFSVSVDAFGMAKIDVIDGEVVVAEASAAEDKRRHLSVGYSASLAAGEASRGARLTGVPLLVDHFDAADGLDLNAGLADRQSGILGPLSWLSLEQDSPARLGGRSLEIPFEAPPGRRRTMTRAALDRVFGELVGHRWMVSFKAWLPPQRTTPKHHWVALVVACGDDPAELPFGWDERAAIAIVLSNRWQAGIDFNGGADPLPAPSLEVFPRSDSGTGPYQVVMLVDETDADAARIDVLVNGRELLRGFPLTLDRARGRIFGFHTWTHVDSGAHSHARIDDFCVSGDVAGADLTAADAGGAHTNELGKGLVRE